MIVCRSRKFIFLRVPKNASTSLSVHIAKNIKFTSEDFYTDLPTGKMSAFNMPPSYFSVDQHPNLKWFLYHRILDQNTINSCTVYGVLRNPIDRFFSLFSRVLDERKEITELNKNQIAEQAFKILETCKRPYSLSEDDPTKQIPLTPQSFWLVHESVPISGIILYPNFDNFLKNVTDDKTLQYKFNLGLDYDKTTELTPETMQGIYRWYKDDFILWETFTGEKLYPHASY